MVDELARLMGSVEAVAEATTVEVDMAVVEEWPLSQPVRRCCPQECALVQSRIRIWLVPGRYQPNLVRFCGSNP